MTQHDTPEAVEAMAAWHGEGKAWPSGVPMPQLHSGPATAAMLRRLHKRAVDAEQVSRAQGHLIESGVFVPSAEYAAMTEAVRDLRAALPLPPMLNTIT